MDAAHILRNPAIATALFVILAVLLAMAPVNGTLADEVRDGTSESTQTLADLDRALEAARTEPKGNQVANLMLSRGILLARSGEFSAAEQQFAEITTLPGAFAFPATTTDARLNRARSLLRLQRTAEVADELAAATTELQNDQPPAWRGPRLATVGELYYRLDVQLVGSTHAGSALAALKQAYGLADDSRTVSRALGYMGAIAERAARLEDALAYTRAAVEQAQDAGALDILYVWEWQSARILQKLGQPEPALQSYLLAIDTLEVVRPVLAKEASASFNADVAPLYFDAADLMLSQHDDSAAVAAQQNSLRQVRNTVERFKVAEIQDYFGDECVVGDVDEAQADLLDDDVALVYPILFRDRMEVLISIRGEIYRHTADVSRRTVGRTARDFRRGLVRRPTHRYRAAGKQLYDWLLGPRVEILREADIRTLVFVADGALRTIPPAALWDGEQYLVEQFAVATSLGLSLTSPRSLQKTELNVLASGLSLARGGFAPLPAVGKELDMIQDLYDVTALRDESFRIEPIAEQLSGGNYSVVHVATHGQFKADYRESFLLTYDGRMTMDRLEEVVGMRRFQGEPVELLVLSACETAVGDDRAALGLAGVALKAGARSAIASLWSINDQASAALVGEIYSNLKRGEFSRAEMLQRAQLTLLHDERYDHPFYWSAFLLIGNWL